MRKWVAVLSFFTFLLTVATGCEARLSMPTASGAEAKGDASFYDESSGKLLTGLSDKFDFKIVQWSLSADNDTDEERLIFSVSIKNKTQTSLKNFNCDVLFDESAMHLFTTGLTVYNLNEPVDLLPEVTANGVSYAFDLSVNTDEEIRNLKADKNELLEKVRFVTLKLSWAGGEETVLMDCCKLEKADE